MSDEAEIRSDDSSTEVGTVRSANHGKSEVRSRKVLYRVRSLRQHSLSGGRLSFVTGRGTAPLLTYAELNYPGASVVKCGPFLTSSLWWERAAREHPVGLIIDEFDPDVIPVCCLVSYFEYCVNDCDLVLCCRNTVLSDWYSYSSSLIFRAICLFGISHVVLDGEINALSDERYSEIRYADEFKTAKEVMDCDVACVDSGSACSSSTCPSSSSSSSTVVHVKGSDYVCKCRCRFCFDFEHLRIDCAYQCLSRD